MKSLSLLTLIALTPLPAAAQGIEECDKIYDYALRLEKADKELGYEGALSKLLLLIPKEHPDKKLISDIALDYALIGGSTEDFAGSRRERCENAPRHQNIFPIPAD